MKNNGLLIVFLLIFVCGNIKADDGKKKRADTDSVYNEFNFSYNETKPWEKYDDYSRSDEKIFGKQIAQQLSMIDHQYIIYSKSDYKPDIVKSAIYNSLEKLRQHYKTLIKKGLIDKSIVQSELGSYLMKGYVCYREDTETLETLLNKTSSINEIKEVLDRINLIKTMK